MRDYKTRDDYMPFTALYRQILGLTKKEVEKEKKMQEAIDETFQRIDSSDASFQILKKYNMQSKKIMVMAKILDGTVYLESQGRLHGREFCVKEISIKTRKVKTLDAEMVGILTLEGLSSHDIRENEVITINNPKKIKVEF